MGGRGVAGGWTLDPSLREFERAFLLSFRGRERSQPDVLDSASDTVTGGAVTTAAAGYGDFLRNRFDPFLMWLFINGQASCVSPLLATELLRFFPKRLRNRSFPLDLRSDVDSVPDATSRS